MCTSEEASNNLGVPVGVGLEGLPWVGGGVLVPGTGVAMGEGGCDVAPGAVVTVTVRPWVLVSVIVNGGGSGDSVAVAVGVSVCVGLGVRMGMVMCGRLPQVYDDSEQHEQITQATKKMIP